MSSKRILIRHSGHWERSNYIGGDEVLVYMHVGQLSYDNLVREICEQVDSNGSSDYLVYYTTSMNDGKKTKVALKNDTDFFRLLVEQSDFPIVYVIKKDKQSAAVPENDDLDQSEPVDDEPISSDEDDNRRKDLFKSLAHEFESWIRRPGYIDRIIDHRNFSSEHQEGSGSGHYDDVDIDQSQHQPRNWMIAIPEADSALPLGWEPPSFPDEGQLSVGAIFRSKDELAFAVGMYHIENRVKYRPERSNTTRVGYVCKHSDACSFMLRAVQDAQVWRIIKFEPNHNCQSELSRTHRDRCPLKLLVCIFQVDYALKESF